MDKQVKGTTAIKEKKVEEIMALLKPNAFQEESLTWVDVKKALASKLSYRDLRDLYTLLLCKRVGS